MAPVPLLSKVNALPEAPPEFAAVTEVPAVPPSAELEIAVPLIGVTGDRGDGRRPRADAVGGGNGEGVRGAVGQAGDCRRVVAPTVAVKPPGDDVTV